MAHLKAIKDILDIIWEYAEANPDLRFHQILWNLGILEWYDCENGIILDKYHHESTRTLADLQVGTIKKRSDR